MLIDPEYQDMLDLWKLIYAEVGRVTSTPRIPSIMHHIWLTNTEAPKYMSPTHVVSLENEKRVLSQDRYNSWQIKIWTNHIASVPAIDAFNSEVSVKVCNIDDIGLKTADLSRLENLIKRQYWGMASDFLRYLIVYKFGGFYADLGAEFNRAPELDMYKYSFITNEWSGFLITNNFFAAEPFHFSLGKTLITVRSNLDCLDPVMLDNVNINIKDLTTEFTAEPFNLGFYLYLVSVQPLSHRVVPHSKFHNYKEIYFDCGADSKCAAQCLNNEEAKILEEHGICAIDALFIGQDNLEGETWF